ncbi:restriction endonuclease subunit S [Candidatus Pacearchaeota archaeon]|nr:restriction endonuclease subunit S [Candidatus Pacearchaeota archaeon]
MMEINRESLSNFLSLIEFKLKDGEEETYSKKYRKHNAYEIVIKVNRNFKSSLIDYGNKINVGRRTITNFSKPENFVILECVDRLLEKGYSPEKIFLEKDWRQGHNEGGKLDIQVLDKNNKSFLMIECKTWDTEYKKYVQETYMDGSQIFPYFNNDKNTKFLCLYASYLDGEKIFYKSSIIKVTEDMRDSATSQEAFERWKPQVFETNGLFEDVAEPYQPKFTGLKKEDLVSLTKDDGGDIFNRFAEILRKNVVSDKTNAYNKIFNLFLCKIVDEYKTNEKDKLKFQWEEGETNEEVLLRLNDLYKEGMNEYLNLKISSVDIEKIDKQLKNLATDKEKEIIKQMFIEQKLYTSNDFAFKEVFDKKTFDFNCVVVKEVVKLLERYKIKYETKQQFLGDFFESLLNTGIKQETGQFFTPVPITHFICSSLPIYEIIKEKNANRENHVLPYVLDYASGSGHFLTEIMEIINYYMDKIDDNFFNNAYARKEFNRNKDNFLWAEEYIYGIEKDYRLAKTTKIATFLNGDGEAQIVFGDGLDSFSESKDYMGLLKSERKGKDNQVFDVIVTNPPYSVNGFKTTLRNGKSSFDLFEFLSEKSDEIECLFVERAKQLLKNGGVAGIVLPSSILSNKGIKTKTREFILKNFEVVGIIELGSKTFMKTGTNTIILFLKKLNNLKGLEVKEHLDNAFKSKRDVTINGIKNPIDTYLKEVYNSKFSDFLSILNGKPNEKIIKLDIYKEYASEFYKIKEIKDLQRKRDFNELSEEEQKKVLTARLCSYISEKEKEKLYFFILAYAQSPVLVKIPREIRKQREFLGYKFSERRGKEGLKYLDEEEKTTSLYDVEGVDNPEKVNYYIKNNFLGKKTEIAESLQGVVFYQKLSSLIDFRQTEFNKTINLNPKVEFESKYEKVKLKNNYEVEKGTSITEEQTRKGGIPVIAGGKQPAYYHNSSNREGYTITISGSGANAGYVSFFDKPIFASDCSTIKSTNERIASTKFLYYLLSLNQESMYYLKRGNAQPHVYPKDLENLKIPLPQISIQNEAVHKLDKMGSELIKLKKVNENLIKDKEIKLKEIITNKYPTEKLSNLCEVVRGGSPRPKGSPLYFSKKDTGIHWISISDLTRYKKGKFITNTIEFLTEEGKSKSRYLEKGSLVLTNSGTVGIPAFLGINGCIHDGYLTFLNLSKKISNNYLYYVFNAMKEHLESIAPEGNQKNLNTTIVGNLEIALPPEKKQEEMVSLLDKINKEIEENNLKIKKIQEEQQNALNEILN